MQIFREMHKEQIKSIKFMTIKACNHVKIGQNAFRASMEIFQKSAAKTKVSVRQVDNQARAASRSTKVDAHTSEKVLAAMLKKIELDFKSHEKVDDMAQKMTQEQIDEVKAIEAAKASD